MLMARALADAANTTCYLGACGANIDRQTMRRLAARNSMSAGTLGETSGSTARQKRGIASSQTPEFASEAD
jgi:hypothetical protein